MICLDSYSSMKKGNLKIVVDGGELARNINNKKNKQTSCKPTDACENYYR